MKFFISKHGKDKGHDYHDNFTYMETTKIYICLAITWPRFCYHQQLLQTKGILMGDDGYPWFNFENMQPARQMHVLDDNAPYNYGAQVSNDILG